MWLYFKEVVAFDDRICIVTRVASSWKKQHNMTTTVHDDFYNLVNSVILLLIHGIVALANDSHGPDEFTATTVDVARRAARHNSTGE